MRDENKEDAGGLGLSFSEWKRVSLHELGEIVGGSTPSTKDDNNYGGDIPWITPRDLSTHNERYISRGERNITQKGIKACSSKLLPANTVLFSSRAPIGYIAIARNPVCTNQGFKSIVPNQYTDAMFLFYLLKYNKGLIESLGSGTTFKEVSGNTMKNIEVLVPDSIEVQKAIAETLSCLDDKIELNNKINANLEQTAQAIFKSWFVDFEPFQDGEFVESELGRIPKGWQYNSVQNLMNVIYGAPFSSSLFNETKEGYPLIRIRDLKTFNPQYYTDENHPNLELVQSGDIIFGMDAEFRPCIWQGKTGVLNQRVCKVTSNHKSVCDFFIYFVLKPHLDFIEYYKVGTTVSHIGKSDIDKINIVIPPYSILEQYKDIVEPMYKQLLINSQENIIISELRNSLLPKLMSGEIDVSQV